MSLKLDNPFLITGYASPEYFCDREKETEDSAQKNRRWLDQPASEKQLNLLAGFGYDVSSPWAWTKYAASCHTAFQFARGGIEKALGVAS